MARPSRSAGALEPGARVGSYVIEALLGVGGMGAVYRARDSRLGRRVALKVVRPDREDRTGVAPEDRLLGEARAVAALRHRHIVQVYDAGVADGLTYLAMEYVEGTPLRAKIGDASVPLQTRKRWLVEIAEALAAAHRVGIVHRDVKPDNVLVDVEGAAVVLDFGLAKRVVVDAAMPTAEEPAPQTAEGRVIGTLSYMAPEQLAGGSPDPAWDQFAWGVLAYETLTGTHPRATVSMPGRTAHLTQTPKMAHEIEPALSFSEAAAVMMAMSPEPSRRFATMDKAIEAFASVEERPPPPSERPEVQSTASSDERPPKRRLLPVAIVAVLATTLGAVVVVAARRPKPAAHSPPATPASTVLNASATAPSASAPATVEIPPSASAPAPVATVARVAAAHPDDWGARCQCMHPTEGPLCPPGSQTTTFRCFCTRDHEYLSTSRGDTVIGAYLSNGQRCQGADSDGRLMTGALSHCGLECDRWKFSGEHRTKCVGVRNNGQKGVGLLSCF
jgi:serine/threonine protein kinase